MKPYPDFDPQRQKLATLAMETAATHGKSHIFTTNYRMTLDSRDGNMVTRLERQERPKPLPLTAPAEQRPTPNLYFEGRKDELAEAIEALSQGKPVLFFGESGIGKTATLRQLAHSPLADNFDDGVIYLSAGNQSAADILQQIFNHFFKYRNPFKPSISQVQNALLHKHILLLLDDVAMDEANIELLQQSLPESSLAMTAPERFLWTGGRSIALPPLNSSEALRLGHKIIEGALKRPLEKEERVALRVLCDKVDGHPQQLMQGVGLVAEKEMSLVQLDPDQLQAQLLDALDHDEQETLVVMAGLDNIPLSAVHLGDLTDSIHIAPTLEVLLACGAVSQNGNDQYTVAENLRPILQQQGELAGALRRSFEYFVNWTARNSTQPKALLQSANTLLGIIQLAAQTDQFMTVLPLVTTLEGPLAHAGYWDRWQQTLEWGQYAAGKLGSSRTQALMVHQLGSRAICMDDIKTAQKALLKALNMRQTMEDDDGAYVTRQNLNLVVSDINPADAVAGAAPRPSILLPSFGQFTSQMPETAARVKKVPAFLEAAILLGSMMLLCVVGWALWTAFPLSSDQAGGFDSAFVTVTAPAQAPTITAIIDLGEAANDGGLTQQPVAGGVTPSPTDGNNANGDIGVAPTRNPTDIAEMAPPDVSKPQPTAIPPTPTWHPTPVLPTPIPPTSTPMRPTATPIRPNPAPRLLVNPPNLYFAETAVGSMSGSQTVMLQNDGTALLSIFQVSLGGNTAGDYIINSDGCSGRSLEPRQSCVLNVSFYPQSSGPRDAALFINSNSVTGNNSVALWGYGVQTVALHVSPEGINFGDQVVGTSSTASLVTLHNQGSSNISINQVQLAGNGFMVGNDLCSFVTLAPNAGCTIGVYFSPNITGRYNGSLSINSTAGSGVQSVFLVGQGIAASQPSPTASPVILPSATPQPSLTPTPMLPTATPLMPTATPLPPTPSNTPLPPTPTMVLPTATPLPPTATPQPLLPSPTPFPTATLLPPATATPAPQLPTPTSEMMMPAFTPTAVPTLPVTL